MSDNADHLLIITQIAKVRRLKAQDNAEYDKEIARLERMLTEFAKS